MGAGRVPGEAAVIARLAAAVGGISAAAARAVGDPPDWGWAGTRAGDLSQGFTVVAEAAGLAVGLRWLISVLHPDPGVVGLVAVLRGLLGAVETGEPHRVILHAVAAVETAVATP
ncbi:hypothetical protein V5P93_006272 [Actinokineospora auranticolor]|uniref:Uncharacterized protein n=1 Tax=Actinokineospora auranticolor TaxID=155976 RepID=A0A2S6GI22_9PSEU|nr:hypothetical protein [Actinokineospora auranticolor]PPK64869.1 hypothetical protein CLV40_117108 [Actinokineospora auranticolor]